MSLDSTSHPPLLLLGPERARRRLAGAVLLLGFRALEASDATEALRAIAGAALPVASGLVSSNLLDPARELHEIQSSVALPVVWTLYGARPEPQSCAELRRAGVRFFLGDPFTEDDLRFVLDTAQDLEAIGAPRDAPRVPASLRARVITKTGERVAVACNLSTGGAYFATPRPAMRGGRIEFELPLPGLAVRGTAEVLWTNVPGNLRRPQAPIGMGVRFEALSSEAHAALANWIDARVASYRL